MRLGATAVIGLALAALYGRGLQREPVGMGTVAAGIDEMGAVPWVRLVEVSVDP